MSRQPKRNFGYKILKVFPLSELEKHKKHRRLQVYYYKGISCVVCGVTATHIALGEDKAGGKHLDLYDDLGNALTVDHVIPRSKGGPNRLDNYQTMCKCCNQLKGNGDKNVRSFNVNLLKKLFTKPKEIKIGDIVYKAKSNTTVKLIGEVISFENNPNHPKKDKQVKVKEKPLSYYNINSLLVRI